MLAKMKKEPNNAYFKDFLYKKKKIDSLISKNLPTERSPNKSRIKLKKKSSKSKSRSHSRSRSPNEYSSRRIDYSFEDPSPNRRRTSHYNS